MGPSRVLFDGDDTRWCLTRREHPALRSVRAHGVFTEDVRRPVESGGERWMAPFVRVPTWAVVAASCLDDRHPSWRMLKRDPAAQAALLSVYLLGGDLRPLLDVPGVRASPAAQEGESGADTDR